MDLQELIVQILNYLRGMWRYRWQLVIVAWLVAIPGWAAVYKMPDVLRSVCRGVCGYE